MRCSYSIFNHECVPAPARRGTAWNVPCTWLAGAETGTSVLLPYRAIKDQDEVPATCQRLPGRELLSKREGSEPWTIGFTFGPPDSLCGQSGSLSGERLLEPGLSP